MGIGGRGYVPAILVTLTTVVVLAFVVVLFLLIIIIVLGCLFYFTYLYINAIRTITIRTILKITNHLTSSSSFSSAFPAMSLDFTNFSEMLSEMFAYEFVFF